MQRALFLLLLFLLSSVGEQTIAISGKIVFKTVRDGNGEIYAMDANGNHLRNLTRHPAREGSPDWSPNGKQIAFVSYRSKNEEILVGDADIYVMDASGGNVRNLTQHPALDSDPDWSPDGKQILFLSNRDGGINTYVMDADGQNVRQLTNYPPDGEFADMPMWSPDGSQIVFEWVQAGGSGIYVMNTNGRDVQPVSPPEQGSRKGHAAWSPDGQQMLYFTWKDNQVRLGTLMLATRMRENRWESEQVPLPEWFALDTVCWSPDGDHLLFGGGDRELPRVHLNIYRYTFRTEEIVQLTDFPTGRNNSPDWSVHALSVSREGNVATYWGQIKAAGRR